jgi:hypothetical protein
MYAAPQLVRRPDLLPRFINPVKVFEDQPFPYDVCTSACSCLLLVVTQCRSSTSVGLEGREEGREGGGKGREEGKYWCIEMGVTPC